MKHACVMYVDFSTFLICDINKSFTWNQNAKNPKLQFSYAIFSCENAASVYLNSHMQHLLPSSKQITIPNSKKIIRRFKNILQHTINNYGSTKCRNAPSVYNYNLLVYGKLLFSYSIYVFRTLLCIEKYDMHPQLS